MNKITTPIELEAQHDSLIVKIERAEFTDFIKGLLGKPQTIENSYSGPFDINKNNIESIYHLIDQRIRQQNKGDLIQFTVKTIYNDSSSVLINGIDEFMTYSEVRQIIPVRVILTWIYLIKFEDKNAPEKQVIEFSINTNQEKIDKTKNNGISILLQLLGSDGFNLKIEHTARSWGADMENLIANYIKNWQIRESSVKKFIYQNNNKIGFISMLAMFLLFCIGIISVLSSLSEKSIQQAAKAIAESSFDKKLSSLISITNTYITSQHIFTVLVVMLGCFIFSIFFGILMGALANNRPKSFICFNEESLKNKEESIRKSQRDWRYFIGTAVAGTISGVMSRYIYDLLF